MQRIHFREHQPCQQREACRIADEAAKGAGIEQAHHPVVKPAEDDCLFAEACLRICDIVHAKPGSDSRQNNEGHPDKAGVLDPELAAIVQGDRCAAHGPENARRDDDGHQELHDRHTKVAQPSVQCERIALLCLWEEIGDIGHGGSKVATAQSTQKCEHEEDQIRRFRILHRVTNADRR